MGIDLRQELINLIANGTTGLLRKTTGTAPTYTGGEYDVNDPRYWEGRSYRDYEIKYYDTTLSSIQLRDMFGLSLSSQRVIFIAADPDKPQPTLHDTLVTLKYSLNGVVVETDGVGTKTYQMAGLYKLNSVLPYRNPEDGRVIFYAVSNKTLDTGWAGRA